METTNSSRTTGRCPHYDRDTCLIHFKCCTEGEWYPCHKCHNEALALTTTTNTKYIVQDSGEQPDHATRNNTESTEASNGPAERSPSEIEVNNEHEAGANQTHSEATSVDGTQLWCAACGSKQKFSHNVALALITNPNNIVQDSDKLPDHKTRNNASTEIPNCPAERSSSEAEVNNERKDPHVQDLKSSDDALEETDSAGLETLKDSESNNELDPEKTDTDSNGVIAIETSVGSDLQAPEDPLNQTHSEATALEGTQLWCTTCGSKYEKSSHNEAAALIINPNDIVVDGGKLPDHETRSNASTEIPNYPAERSSGEVEVNNEHEDPMEEQDFKPSDDATEETHSSSETLNDPEPNHEFRPNKSDTDGNEPLAIETSEKSNSQVPNDPSNSQSAGANQTHSEATALDGTRLRCTACNHEQEFSKSCGWCSQTFADHFCDICKLLIGEKFDAYHCPKCKICRGNKKDHFHCDECNVCMAQCLKENHKCCADRGHDPCAICYEEVFSGAIILPCFHMLHRECAEKLLLSGSHTCPMCRTEIIQNAGVRDVADDTQQQSTSIPGSFKQFLCSCRSLKKLSMIFRKNAPDAIAYVNSG